MTAFLSPIQQRDAIIAESVKNTSTAVANALSDMPRAKRIFFKKNDHRLRRQRRGNALSLTAIASIMGAADACRILSQPVPKAKPSECVFPAGSSCSNIPMNNRTVECMSEEQTKHIRQIIGTAISKVNPAE